MMQAGRARSAVLAALAFVGVLSGADLRAQGPNTEPNPYRTVEGWAKMPQGRTWGATSAVEIDRDGKSIWVGERCGANTCAGSSLPAILKFDADGRLVTSFAANMFIFPHGFHVDPSGNVWLTDARGKDGKGHQVFKFGTDGKLLLTLGKAGVTGTGPDTFNQPSDVAVSASGEIFVADGHDEDSNARIVKFTKDGKFIKTWGKRGSGPGEFDTPHGLAFDSKGRLFVADRSNNRIQIFDQDGKYLAEWKQFGRPSGVYIDKNDMLYVTDSESNAKTYPGFKRGIRVGSAKDGKVTAFIPDPEPDPEKVVTSAGEGVAADAQGNIYGAEVGPRALKRYVKK
ncbi:MAG TPA: peptidyl-alpha-hydroxyglycine alpha-amidating lyase family protein [Vicinamibacteria bacterium]